MIHRVEICGGIAVGKTSLALLLSQPWGEVQFAAAFEDYQRISFWRDKYGDATYDFTRNLAFILTHFEVIISADPNRICLCDFAMLDNLAYAELSDPVDLPIIEMVYNRIRRQLPPPALVIKLTCRPVTRLYRILKRGRRQEAGISEACLERLIAAIDRRLVDEQDRSGVPVLNIDTDATDYVGDAELAREVRNDVFAALLRLDTSAQPPTG